MVLPSPLTDCYFAKFNVSNEQPLPIRWVSRGIPCFKEKLES